MTPIKGDGGRYPHLHSPYSSLLCATFDLSYHMDTAKFPCQGSKLSLHPCTTDRPDVLWYPTHTSLPSGAESVPPNAVIGDVVYEDEPEAMGTWDGEGGGSPVAGANSFLVVGQDAQARASRRMGKKLDMGRGKMDGGAISPTR